MAGSVLLGTITPMWEINLDGPVTPRRSAPDGIATVDGRPLPLLSGLQILAHLPGGQTQRLRSDVEDEVMDLVAIHELPNEAYADLRDPDAARLCPCSCHPRAADPLLHGGGKDCTCQLTPDERRARMASFFDDLVAIGEESGYAERMAAERAEAEQVAKSLDASITIETVACPLQIVGEVDGIGFYLRERHGSYRLERYPARPTNADIAGDTGVVVAHGNEDDLGSGLADAVRLAVRQLRDHERATACAHPHSGRFCADCGTRLTD